MSPISQTIPVHRSNECPSMTNHFIVKSTLNKFVAIILFIMPVNPKYLKSTSGLVEAEKGRCSLYYELWEGVGGGKKRPFIFEHYSFSTLELDFDLTFPVKRAQPSKAVTTCALSWSCHIICFTLRVFTARFSERIFPPWSSTLNRFPVKLKSVTELSILHLSHSHPWRSVAFSHFLSPSLSKSHIKCITPSVFIYSTHKLTLTVTAP